MRSLLIFRPGGHFASPATEAGTWIARQNGFANEPRLRFLRKTAAIAQKGDMIAIENPRLLGIECEFFAPGKQRLDTPKQSIVQEDFAAMTGKFWRDLAFDRLNLVIGVGARQMKKNRTDAGKIPAASFKRLDCIFERFGSRVLVWSISLASMFRREGADYT